VVRFRATRTEASVLRAMRTVPCAESCDSCVGAEDVGMVPIGRYVGRSDTGPVLLIVMGCQTNRAVTEGAKEPDLQAETTSRFTCAVDEGIRRTCRENLCAQP
jgi:hypothetical protein